MNTLTNTETLPILITAGTGKTGQRTAQRLSELGYPVRVGSRSTTPAFDWRNRATWTGALTQTSAAYISYVPDLAVPGAPDDIADFCRQAVAAGCRRLVLLSGRGEDQAEVCEQAVAASGAAWTVLRCSWFNQNFSQGYLIDAVLDGSIVLPAADVGEPFVDADDIADVATAAFTSPGHVGRVYELTGPRLLTFAEAAGALSRATGREISYTGVTPVEFTEALNRLGVPTEEVDLLNYLFATVLDGRNAHLDNGVQQVLGRSPKDFTVYAAETAATGIWNVGS
jgi:uncharacterized protein YbjT (DUF2867 family)